MFPSPQYRQCTSDLKRGPIDKFIRSLPHKVIVNCMGIRSEESHPRSLLSPLTRNEALSTRQQTVYNWLPIFDRTLSDVLAWHGVNAIRLHTVYVPEYHKDGTLGGISAAFPAESASSRATQTLLRFISTTAMRSMRSPLSNAS